MSLNQMYIRIFLLSLQMSLPTLGLVSLSPAAMSWLLWLLLLPFRLPLLTMTAEFGLCGLFILSFTPLVLILAY